MVRVVGAEEPIVGENPRQGMIASLWIGAVNGTVLWVLTYFLSNYVINNIACRLGTSFVDCSETAPVSAGISLIVAAVITLVFMVRQRIYRPLLVALASSVVLWGITGSWLEGASWTTLLLTILTSAAVYTAIAWLARVRSLLVALLAIVATVVTLRFILMI